MNELSVSAGKFHRLLDYIRKIDLDVAAIAASVNLQPERVLALDESEPLPALQYAKLYKAAVAEMQEFKHPIPWGAGVGTEAFEFLCRSMITALDLGEALAIAERFDHLLYPMIGYNMRLLQDEGSDIVRLSYRINLKEEGSILAPSHWDRSGYQETVARASGLEVWFALCGWLTGRPMKLVEANIAAPFLNHAYADSMSGLFQCPVHFDAAENTLVFQRAMLDRRLVHTRESLLEFLDSSIYHLIAVDRRRSSTSAAIKSLIAIDLERGLPSFTSVAHSLHMSESSLRRRLQKEDTSYQSLKDEVRCEVAIDRLLNYNAKVADIADYLGFTEPSSFVRSFKSWTGETPKSYKDRMQSMGV
jgi:AraC-like DNA-binding protein